jgi:hypothetical protein
LGSEGEYRAEGFALSNKPLTRNLHHRIIALMGKSQIPVPVIAMSLLILVSIGGYVLTRHTQSSSLPQTTSISQLSTLPTQVPTNVRQAVYTVPPIAGWKTFTNPYLHYTIQYPSFLLSPADKEYNPDGFGALDGDENKRTYIEQSREIIFYTPSKQFPGIGFAFSVAAGKLTRNNATHNTIRRLAESLFTNPVGIIANPAPSGLNDSNETVTELADLTINGNQAVHFTDAYAGSTQQPPNETEEYMIKKGDMYYLLSHGTYWTTGDKSKDASLFKTIANSFSPLK